MLPKINLRDLFWLMVAVALGTGWWMEQRQRQEQEQRLQKATVEAIVRESELKLRGDTLEQQYRQLYARHAVDHRFHFDIYQHADGKVDVRYIDDDVR